MLHHIVYCILSGSLLISWPETLAVDALPVLGFLAKVVRRLHESYVVGLCSRIFDVNICNRTNLIRLRSLWLSENVETAFVISCNQGWVICRHFSRIWGRALILATAQKNPGIWQVLNHIALKRRILRSECSSTELAGLTILLVQIWTIP